MFAYEFDEARLALAQARPPLAFAPPLARYRTRPLNPSTSPLGTAKVHKIFQKSTAMGGKLRWSTFFRRSPPYALTLFRHHAAFSSIAPLKARRVPMFAYEPDEARLALAQARPPLAFAPPLARYRTRPLNPSTSPLGTAKVHKIFQKSTAMGGKLRWSTFFRRSPPYALTLFRHHAAFSSIAPLKARRVPMFAYEPDEARLALAQARPPLAPAPPPARHRTRPMLWLYQ